MAYRLSRLRNPQCIYRQNTILLYKVRFSDDSRLTRTTLLAYTRPTFSVKFLQIFINDFLTKIIFSSPILVRRYALGRHYVKGFGIEDKQHTHTHSCLSRTLMFVVWRLHGERLTAKLGYARQPFDNCVRGETF